MPKRMLVAAITLAMLAGHPSAAHAGLYTDELSKCLVAKASDSDKTTLVRWIFASITASAAVRSMSTTTPSERLALHRSTASIFERLTTVACRPEVVTALKYEGPHAFETSFGVLGEIAMRGLMSDPLVGAEMQAFGQFFDKEKMRALGKEAGIPEPVPSPPANWPSAK
jgi:hypothetical protein